MSRFMHGDSVQVMGGFPDKSIDFILTDPPYLVGFKDRSGRTITNDVNSTGCCQRAGKCTGC